MNPPRVSSSFTVQILVAVLLLCLAGIAGAAYLLFSAINRSDAEASARQMRFAESGLAAEARELPRQQQGSTIWDEAVERVRAGDRGWIAANLGVWLNEFYDIDQTYVLAPDGRAIYASVGRNSVPPAHYAEVAAELQPVVDRLRAMMRSVSFDPEDSTGAIADLAQVELITLSGQVVMVSAVPIVPESEAIAQAPGTEFVHIALQLSDAAMATRVAAPYELSLPEFVAAAPSDPDRIGVPLLDQEGTALGWLTWNRDRPGLRMIHAMLPAIALMALLGLGLLAFLLARLAVASQKLHRSEAQARHLAFHDGLTGLPNRALFDDRLSQAMLLAGRKGPPVSLLSVDLDRFKYVNDTLGHPAGDELVRQVAGRIRACLRQGDTVARLGGDEFAVILMGMGEEGQLGQFCKTLIDRLSQPYFLGAGEAHVTASVGAVLASSVQGGADEALRNVDAALYRAKHEGRARYSIFTREMDDIMRRRHAIERELRSALEGGDQLEVVYQPIFDEDGTLLGAEALARWAHPTHGALPPEVFIGIAEERGLIHALGLRVLEKACRCAVAARLPKIAVNVSPIQLRDEGFARSVLEVLARTGLPPERLELELTEKIALDYGGTTRQVLAALHAAGVSIALDDFATGQSSLHHVRDFSVDMLKIDRSFTHRLGSGDGTDEMVQAILDLARAMRVEVTAEGVETPAQRERLLAMGCHRFQGFLLARPMEAGRLVELSAVSRSARQKSR